MTCFLSLYFWHAFTIIRDVILPLPFLMITLYGLWLWYLFSYFLCEISFPELCSRRRLGLDNFSNFTELIFGCFYALLKIWQFASWDFEPLFLSLFFSGPSLSMSLLSLTCSNLILLSKVGRPLLGKCWSVHFVGEGKTPTKFCSSSQIGLLYFTVGYFRALLFSEASDTLVHSSAFSQTYTDIVQVSWGLMIFPTHVLRFKECFVTFFFLNKHGSWGFQFAI